MLRQAGACTGGGGGYQTPLCTTKMGFDIPRCDRGTQLEHTTKEWGVQEGGGGKRRRRCCCDNVPEFPESLPPPPPPHTHPAGLWGAPWHSPVLFPQALQECPNSGLLWAEAVELEPPASKKAKSKDAVKRCDKDARVIVAVAKLFWAERKCDKARSWFNRAVALDSDLGDAWAYFYRFEVQHGTEDQQKAVLRRAEEADPKHGEKWTQVTKSLDHCTVGGCRLTTEQSVKKVAVLCDTKGYNMA